MLGMGIPSKLKNACLLFGVVVSINAHASGPHFNLINFKCSLRNAHLLTQIHFYVDLSQAMTGEIDNYQVSGRTRSYVSGDLLYHPEYSDGKISGSTGDPDAFKDTFTLTRTGNNNGTWHYTEFSQGMIASEANFNCSYHDAP